MTSTLLIFLVPIAVLYWYYSRHALDVANPLPVIRISSIVLPNLSGNSAKMCTLGFRTIRPRCYTWWKKVNVAEQTNSSWEGNLATTGTSSFRRLNRKRRTNIPFRIIPGIEQNRHILIFLSKIINAVLKSITYANQSRYLSYLVFLIQQLYKMSTDCAMKYTVINSRVGRFKSQSLNREAWGAKVNLFL